MIMTKEKFEISISAARLTDIGITRTANGDALLLADMNAGGQNVDSAAMTQGTRAQIIPRRRPEKNKLVNLSNLQPAIARVSTSRY